LLAIVDEEEDLAGTEERGQQVGQRALAGFADAERIRDRRQDERGVANGREVDENRAVREGRGDIEGDGEGKAGFADTAGTGQGQERDGPFEQVITGGGHHRSTADERRAWSRQDYGRGRGQDTRHGRTPRRN
jgi:hypothetical protein